MGARIIAIGDIHGYSEPLELLLNHIAPGREDIIVTLGDYIDRGPDSRGVIDRLMALQRETTLIPILGNHDEMLLNILDGDIESFADWLQYGGAATLASYGCPVPEQIPEDHIQFLRGTVHYYEINSHFFIHASYLEHLPLYQQNGTVLRWQSLRERIPGPHLSGKIAIAGHTAQKNFQVLNLGHLICIDTCCYGGGWLTALDVLSGRLWQASPTGEFREGQLERQPAV